MTVQPAIEVPRPTKAAQDICLTCGLCCDGTIFRHVGFENGEAVQSSVFAGCGIEILKDAASGERYFEQPCSAHDGRYCTIYADRPLVCRNFECKLLKACAEGKIEVAAALDVIKTAKERKARLVEHVAQLGFPFKPRDIVYDLFRQVLDLAKKSGDDGLKKQCADIALEISAFKRFISLNFKNLEIKKKARPGGVEKS
jgi:uncharacterized protein